MAERPEDFNLPNSVITRIVKDALPEGVNVSKEAKSALSKAASVFVLYATTCANNFTLKDKRKTLSGNDVLAAVQDMEFDMLLEPLQESLNALRTVKAKKGDSSGKSKKENLESDRTVDGEDDEQEMEVYQNKEENQNVDEL
ncbi:DNA polymerase epsilon subunit 3-like [Limulus polyphemus]|uniref:DNA polymerase epsilon subunit 3 n=1 Tax=Limulus polyphemus TaxID=6850 RepID=A0ABM1SZW2_LIMPO|nr:DNA polymerase epsilon subunit 3-like [Limulus polyphemus]XP_022249168.1 DNA polymerase epsilon subunit 3-like [Limulus polyphemus]XP_022249169.1 DNA polymerase epsilon subunit 3-like [Limulus polyphemus]XP_022249170.1 DNA polymerase epsilon subunit 3-like [Limulus polyphemus]